MTEIDLYSPPLGVDSWTGVLTQVGDLAAKIAGTDFVPDSMKGKPAAVAAAILTGREMGIGPMASLQNIHIIKGKPGMSANLMRQLILQAGHDLRYVETTDTRCVIEGRRRGTEDWTRVTFNADQARKAKIDLGTYPEDKLVARATSRLARRVFADCLGGMPYLAEEAAEGASDAEPATVSVTAGPPKRTAKRADAVSAPAAVTRGEVAPAPTVASDAPPLPGDEPDPDGITAAQLKKIGALMREAGITDRTEALDMVSSVIGRAIETRNDLTKAEAHTLIEHLEAVPSAEPVDADTGEILDAEVLDPDEPSWPEAAKPGSRS